MPIITIEEVEGLASHLGITFSANEQCIELDGCIQGTFSHNQQGIEAAYETLVKLQVVIRAEEERAPMISQELATIRIELIKLSELRRKAKKANDPITRLFAQAGTIPTSWQEVDNAKETLEQKVPGFLVQYNPAWDSFVLVPKPESE